MNTFLEKDYSLPKTKGGYMKFEQGENKFRVLSDAITGYEYWNNDNKPVRSKDYPDNLVDPKKGNIIKNFWAMIVYNYQNEAVEILQITQRGIQESMLNYLHDEDFGEPENYDVVIKRKGEGLETRYDVIAKPPKAVDSKILEAYKDIKIDLTKLYDGENPFEGDSDNEVSADENPLDSIPF